MSSLNEFNDDDELLASINIIPFVDIVLVLLVIFMLTSATIVRASLKVELPKAAPGDHELIGRSPQMLEVYKAIGRVAPQTVTRPPALTAPSECFHVASPTVSTTTSTPPSSFAAAVTSPVA